MECPLWVRDEFKYLRVLFTSEGRGKWEINRWLIVVVWCVEKTAECKSEEFDIPVDLRLYPQLWSYRHLLLYENCLIVTPR